MSNVPLPEPHHQSAANFNAPDEPFYTADQMHAHAAAVSAAKDAEIAQLRADLIKSLADNAPLRERAMVLEDALLRVARMAEALKKDCGMDPESPQAVRNGQYMNISYAARAALEKP